MTTQDDAPRNVRAALFQALFFKNNGKPDHASAWAAELCRLIGCADIVNPRGQELRRDFHAGPRNAVMGLITATALSLAFAAPACALQECTPGKQDSRIRYCTYSPSQIYHIWTAPGAILVIQFADDESVPEGNVAATDASRLERKPRGNYLYLKNTAKAGDTPCMVPEPLLVTTKLPNGQLRPYQFQFETRPNDCSETPAEQIAQQQQKSALSMVSTAEAAPKLPPRPGNLKYVAENGLGPNANVFYAAVFKYPDDEAAKRREAYRARHADDDSKQAQHLLKQQVSWPYGNKFDGTWNYKYAAHGNLAMPAEIRDNGYQTVFLFPSLERVPALFRWNPAAAGCNRNHDDRNEATVNPSVHRGGSDGDTIIASGTAPGWCMRDGQTVLEIRNLAYTLVGATPATGTVSPYVQRTLKDAAPEPTELQPVPLTATPPAAPAAKEPPHGN
jgi:type IV secretion system protein VirB9